MNGVKNWLNSHPQIDVIQKSVRYAKEEKYRDHMSYYLDPECVIFEHLGNLNSEKTIYYIYIDSKSGFFANIHTVLCYMYYAELHNFAPCVSWSKNTLYTEADYSKDPFEYYYTNTNCKINEVEKSHYVVRNQKHHLFMFENQNAFRYDVEESMIARLAIVAKKYLKLNSETQKYIENSIKKIIPQGKKILGVHIRSTDFNLEFNGHPKVVSVDTFIVEVERALEQTPFEYIFLATDSEAVVEKFKSKFNNKLLFYSDVVRSNGEDNKSVAISIVDRKKHHYKLGLEVIRDCYTLANCDGLIAGLSRVSECARIIKKSNDLNYMYCKIIDQGINHNGNSALEYERKGFRIK